MQLAFFPRFERERRRRDPVQISIKILKTGAGITDVQALGRFEKTIPGAFVFDVVRAIAPAVRERFYVVHEVEQMAVCERAQSVRKRDRRQIIFRAVFVDDREKLFFLRGKIVARAFFLGENFRAGAVRLRKRGSAEKQKQQKA